MKKIVIKTKRYDHECGDGCCYETGVDYTVNEKYLGGVSWDDTNEAITLILAHLGYQVEFEDLNDEEFDWSRD